MPMAISLSISVAVSNNVVVIMRVETFIWLSVSLSINKLV